MTKIAVLVSGGGTNLQALIDAQNDGIIKSGKIVLVVSDKEGAYALERAKNAGIDSLYIKKGEGFEEKLTAELEKAEIDIIVLAGFLSILSENFVKKYDKKIINVAIPISISSLISSFGKNTLSPLVTGDITLPFSSFKYFTLTSVIVL